MGIAYSQLNPKQKQAANHVHGPMLVLAGAGTGKTSVLVHRISRLISAKHAHPNEIRAFTFTHKAAREIRSRVARSAAGIGASGLHASTFHGYCYQLLREAGEDFQLLDQFELWTFLRQRVADLPLNRFLRAANPGRFLKDLLTFFDRCSDELVSANTYGEYVSRVKAGEFPGRQRQPHQRGRLLAAPAPPFSARFPALPGGPVRSVHGRRRGLADPAVGASGAPARRRPGQDAPRPNIAQLKMTTL